MQPKSRHRRAVQTGTIAPKGIIIALLLVDNPAQIVYALFKAVYANHGKDIGQTVGNDAKADDCRKYACSNIQVPEA